jgi:glyoxylase-like metal-dependent hydrolase (beta-lactamase superfamily II)
LIIHTLDLNFLDTPHAIAAYLIVGLEGPVLVETGPGSTRENLAARLAEHGYTPADIRHALVTHIHLDHAGAAGWLAQHGAHIYVHQVGAPHLVDPSKLLNSARRIYGDLMDTLWGETLPVPAGRVTALTDGQAIHVAGLTFTALDSPAGEYRLRRRRGGHSPAGPLADLPAFPAA